MPHDLHLGGTPGQTALHLGASGENDRTATLAGRTGGARLAGHLALGTRGLLQARTGGASSISALAYDPNLLSEVVGATGEAWGRAGPLSRAARLGHRDAPPTAVAARGRWTAGAYRSRAGASLWHRAAPVAHAGRGKWGAGRRLEGAALERWKQNPRAVHGVRGVWRSGDRLGGHARAAWLGLPRTDVAAGAVWREGSLLTHALSADTKDGTSLRLGLVARWRDADWVGYVARPYYPPLGPPFRPRVGSSRLCLGHALEGTALHLGRSCPSHRTIYRRRSYLMKHDCSLVRLPERTPIPASRVSVAIDADSWAWTWSATLLGRTARDLVMPSAAGEPVTVELAIDGESWHLLAEEVPLDRRQGDDGIRVSGRGLSAELGAPSFLPEHGHLENARSLQQAMNERLPLDPPWTLVWGQESPDWLLPSGSLTWSGLTPIQILHQMAQGVGLILVPDRTAREIQVLPRYAVLPWDYATATPTLEIPDSLILSAAYAATSPAQGNAVYVHGGEAGGILARVYRSGTAGDRLVPTVNNALITHVDGARLLGSRLLAAQERQPAIRSLTTVFGPGIPLAELGELVEVQVAGEEAVRGVVSGLRLEAAFGGAVEQTISLGEETENRWASWKRLLPRAPVLIAEVIAAHGDGTRTVEYPGGGRQRVRGDASAGTAVWVRDGAIVAVAPSLTAYGIDV